MAAHPGRSPDPSAPAQILPLDGSAEHLLGLLEVGTDRRAEGGPRGPDLEDPKEAEEDARPLNALCKRLSEDGIARKVGASPRGGPRPWWEAEGAVPRHWGGPKPRRLCLGAPAGWNGQARCPPATEPQREGLAVRLWLRWAEGSWARVLSPAPMQSFPWRLSRGNGLALPLPHHKQRQYTIASALPKPCFLEDVCGPYAKVGEKGPYFLTEYSTHQLFTQLTLLQQARGRPRGGACGSRGGDGAHRFLLEGHRDTR